MSVFEKSKWIWIYSDQSPDSYAEFRFLVMGSGRDCRECRLSDEKMSQNRLNMGKNEPF